MSTPTGASVIMAESTDAKATGHRSSMEIRLSPRPDGLAQARFIATLGLLPGVGDLHLSNAVDGVLSIRVTVRSGSDLLATLLAMDPPLLDRLTITDDGDLIARLVSVEEPAETPVQEDPTSPKPVSRVAATMPLRRPTVPPAIAPTVELPRLQARDGMHAVGSVTEAAPAVVASPEPSAVPAIAPTLVMARHLPERAATAEHEAVPAEMATAQTHEPVAAGAAPDVETVVSADVGETGVQAGIATSDSVMGEDAAVAQTALMETATWGDSSAVGGVAATEDQGDNPDALESVSANEGGEPSVVGMTADALNGADGSHGFTRPLASDPVSAVPVTTRTELPFAELGRPRRVRRKRRRLVLVAGAVCALGMAAAAMWWQSRDSGGGNGFSITVAPANGEPLGSGVALAGLALTTASTATATATASATSTTSIQTATVPSSPTPTATPPATAMPTATPTPQATPTPEPGGEPEPERETAVAAVTPPTPAPQPATAPPQPTPAPRPQPMAQPAPLVFLVHTVQRGETVFSLSQRYGVPMATIIAANGLPANGAVAAGREIYIPWR